MIRCLAIAAFLFGCTTEPIDTGVFEQIDVQCEGPEPCYAYQLHIGRYGDAVTGLLVRYNYSGLGFNFAKSSECGCFIIESGVTDGDDLNFQVFLPGAPGVPDAEFSNPECDPIPGDCRDRRFQLTGVDEELSGVTACGDTASAPVAFERVEGRPRTTCLVP